MSCPQIISPHIIYSQQRLETKSQRWNEKCQQFKREFQQHKLHHPNPLLFCHSLKSCLFQLVKNIKKTDCYQSQQARDPWMEKLRLGCKHLQQNNRVGHRSRKCSPCDIDTKKQLLMTCQHNLWQRRQKLRWVNNSLSRDFGQNSLVHQSDLIGNILT